LICKMVSSLACWCGGSRGCTFCPILSFGVGVQVVAGGAVRYQSSGRHDVSATGVTYTATGSYSSGVDGRNGAGMLTLQLRIHTASIIASAQLQ
ncbi:MAG: hypothetical protein KBT04_04340, partial [Bacteroidales bacterium]|nr:hypothetical protein [Candidatus Colimorpha onthohippi]